MNSAFTGSRVETKSIQPYFVLSTQSNYHIKTMHDSVISHFYSFIADNSNGYTFAVPDACIDILFLCDAESPTARICGSAVSAKLVELKKDKRYFGIRFAPGFIPNFSSILPKELIDSEILLEDIDPSVLALIERIAGRTLFTEQINDFMLYYQKYLFSKQSNLVRQVNSLINQYKGDIRITELEYQTGFSARYIYKLFMEQFGLSPKLYCLILRFQQALLNLTSQNTLNLTDLSLELGYADQSHFLREFKKFAATTPKKFSTEVHQSFYQNRISVCN